MIDTATVREQFQRFSRQWDDNSLLMDYADLLRRYLSQPLSDSETAWAYRTLANVLACSEHAAEAVDVHEAFERWLPGKSPRLSANVPWYPADDSPDATMGPDELRVDFLGQSVQFATAYAAIGRYDDFVAKAEAAFAALAPAQNNLEVRFYGLLIFMTASQLAGDFERAERRIGEMHAIADQAGNASKAAQLHAQAVTYEIQLARARNDTARVTAKLQEGLSLIEELERQGCSGNDLSGYRFELAHHLTRSGRHDLALPLLEANLGAGGGSHGDHGYPWLMHAAAVWKVTRDRPRTLALLREARDHDPRDLRDEFHTSAFEDVQDDPEFLQAVSRSA